MILKFSQNDFMIGLWYFKTILKIFLNVRTDYEYWLKSCFYIYVCSGVHGEE